MFGRFRIIDLSVPLEHEAVSEPMPAQIHYVRHGEEGLLQMQRFFGVRQEDLVWSGGMGWPALMKHGGGDPGDHAYRHARRCALPLRANFRRPAGPSDR